MFIKTNLAPVYNLILLFSFTIFSINTTHYRYINI